MFIANLSYRFALRQEGHANAGNSIARRHGPPDGRRFYACAFYKHEPPTEAQRLKTGQSPKGRLRAAQSARLHYVSYFDKLLNYYGE